MKTNTTRMLRAVGAASLRTIALASMAIAAAACGTAEDAALDEITEETAPLTAPASPGQTSNLYYDNNNYNGNFTWVNGIKVHSCLPGYAMQGLYGDTWLKCRKFNAVPGSVPEPDFGPTQGWFTPPSGWYGYGWSYTQMHSCPDGKVMVGVSASKNWLLCQSFVPTSSTNNVPYRDDRSQDTESKNIVVNKPPVMHVCGLTQTDDLMMGVHFGNNQLGCAHEVVVGAAQSLPPPH